MLAWMLILTIITTPLPSVDKSLPSLHRFQRRDIRRYDRAIRKLERRKNLDLRRYRTIPENLLYYSQWYCKSE